MTLERCCSILLAVAIATSPAWAHEYVKKLRSPATVKGLIGGESHDSYVIHARRGQTMTVEISWKPEHDENGDNHAEFWVGTLPDFDGNGEAKFGTESDQGKRWTGKVPTTGNYYIYVLAHPSAEYRLNVTVQ